MIPLDVSQIAINNSFYVKWYNNKYLMFYIKINIIF